MFLNGIRYLQRSVASVAETVETQSQDTETMEVEDDSQREISENRLNVFKKRLFEAYKEKRVNALSLVNVTEFVNANLSTPFSRGEIDAAIDRMTADNQVMLADASLFLI